jgi:hypothetical protein
MSRPPCSGTPTKLLLARLGPRVAERRLVVLERAHLLELLLHPAPALERELEHLGQLVGVGSPCGYKIFTRPDTVLRTALRSRALRCAAQREVPVDDLGEVVLPQLAQRLGEVVDHEAVVVGEQVVAHLRISQPGGRSAADR